MSRGWLAAGRGSGGSGAHVLPSRRRHLSLVAVVALVLTLLAFPASSTATTKVRTAPAAAPKADWTMMVYAVGDTVNVAEVMVRNLAALTKLPSMSNANIVVLVDLPERTDPGAPSSRLPGLDQFTTAKLLLLRHGGYQQIRDLGEVQMGRPDVLAGFIAEAADRFPAKKYGLTLFDHGSGVQGGYIDTGPPSTSGLSLPDIRAGMQAGMQRAGIDRFEVLFHAACLMANYETASALAPLTKTMAASEELMISTPIAVEGYQPLRTDASGVTVGKALIDGYGAFLDGVAKEPGGQAYRDIAAMSVVDESRMKNLDSAVEAFARVAAARMPEIASEVARARAKALEFIVGIPGETAGDSMDLVDLGDFLRNLQNVPSDVAVARNAVYTALKQVVLHQVTGRGTKQASGLNVYLPKTAARVGSYLTDGTAPRGWGSFVRSFLDTTSGSPANGGPGSGVAFSSRKAQIVQQDKSGIKIQGKLRDGDAARVISSELQVFSRLGDQDNALALVMPAYLNAGGVGNVQGVWDYSVTVLANDNKKVPVTAMYQPQSGGLLGSFRAQYTSPAGEKSDIGVRVLLSSQGNIQSVTVADVSNGAASGIDLQTGGQLRPYIVVSTGGPYRQVLSSQSVQITSSLRVGFDKLAAGSSFEMGVVVSDAAQNGDFASASARVP